jgi:hypothetical protein
MPSIHQRGTDYRDYDTQADRWCATMSERALLRVRPTGADVAAEYAAAAKRQGCSDAVKQHFERIAREERA